MILDDYCHNLKRSEKEKRSLLKLLEGAETFYDLAQEEAKVIVTVRISLDAVSIHNVLHFVIV